MVFIGDPPLFLPVADEVHISVTFTWDIDEGRRLVEAWGQLYPVVKIGGPAMGDKPDGFTPGLYLKQGVTFTTRGCNNHCPWCLVPEREGGLVEISDFAPGWIIQDNNVLQSSHKHLERIGQMLEVVRKQTRHYAVFSGGLDARLVNDWVAEWLSNIKIKEVFLAADTVAALGPLEKAIKKLSFLDRRKLRVYTMLAYGGESIEAATDRLETVWSLGGLPFAQLYQPADHFIQYSREWKQLARTWSRPAAMFKMHSERRIE
jgi:hypothetical protein